MRTEQYLIVAVVVAWVGAGCSGGGGGGGGSGTAEDTAPAIPAPYVNDFESASAFDGWLFQNPATQDYPTPQNQTLWAHDGTNPAMPGGPAYSGSSSLNYNDGVDYETGATNHGIAISPKIDISAMTAPVLAFRCNYETEEPGLQYDQRKVAVGALVNGSVSYYVNEQLSTNPGNANVGACNGMGTWHLHVVSLVPSWGQIRVGFEFDSVDGFLNEFAGWYIDDLQIVEASELNLGGVPGGNPTLDPTTGLPGGTTGGTPGGTVGGTPGGTIGGTPGGTIGGTPGGTTGGTPGGTTGGTPGGTVGATPVGGGTGGSTAGGSATGGSTGGATSGTGATETILSWTFDGADALDWVLENGSAAVGWNTDGLPADVAGGEAFVSAPSSLNYNDDTDYDSGSTNSGMATGPALALSGLTDPKLLFWCNYQTEDPGTNWDIRIVQVVSEAGEVLLETQLATNPGSAVAGPCAAMGTWHQHEIALDPAWGTVMVRFAFDTVDALFNNYAGWFVDDVELVAAAVGAGSGSTGGSGGGSTVSGSGGSGSPGSAGSGSASSSVATGNTRGGRGARGVCAASSGGQTTVPLAALVAIFAAVLGAAVRLR